MLPSATRAVAISPQQQPTTIAPPFTLCTLAILSLPSAHFCWVVISTQAMMLHFMALCPEDVSKIKVGSLSNYTCVVVVADVVGFVYPHTRVNGLQHCVLASPAGLLRNHVQDHCGRDNEDRGACVHGHWFHQHVQESYIENRPMATKRNSTLPKSELCIPTTVAYVSRCRSRRSPSLSHINASSPTDSTNASKQP